MIELENVTIRAGDFVKEDICFCVPQGSYTALMGKTGSGKTSILEAICGLKKITQGAIRLNGVDVTRWSPSDRQVGYVPQDLALFPTMTVRQHLEFALKLRGWKRDEITQQTGMLSEKLGIEKLLNRLPQGLSGGEAQRVALGRALSFRPACLLLDEPLSALDRVTRTSLQSLLSDLNRTMQMTVLHVTHDENEADCLADDIIRLT